MGVSVSISAARSSRCERVGLKAIMQVLSDYKKDSTHRPKYLIRGGEGDRSDEPIVFGDFSVCVVYDYISYFFYYYLLLLTLCAVFVRCL